MLILKMRTVKEVQWIDTFTTRENLSVRVAGGSGGNGNGVLRWMQCVHLCPVFMPGIVWRPKWQQKWICNWSSSIKCTTDGVMQCSHGLTRDGPSPTTIHVNIFRDSGSISFTHRAEWVGNWQEKRNGKLYTTFWLRIRVTCNGWAKCF